MKINFLGLVDYQSTFDAMKAFTQTRLDNTEDELWVLEHSPVFTQGKAGRAEHVLCQTDIPIVQTDRGGQVTYHGPGQLVIYTLIDFGRRDISVRELVSRIENAIILCLSDYGIEANSDPKRPGVYVAGRKIASLGLRISKQSVYHGLSLNVAMDLAPFHAINPCGYQGLEMTQMKDLLSDVPSMGDVSQKLAQYLADTL